MEEKIYEIITEAFGAVYEPAPKKEVEQAKINSNETLIMATDYFIKNPSANNYNLLKTAMLTYQYWSQKKVIE